MPIKFNGATSGYTQLQAAAVAGNNILTLPTTGTTLLSDGNTVTFTQTQTFAGNTGALAFACNNIGEPVTIVAAAPSATTNYDITTQSVLYYTTNAANNWTLNFRASSTTTLNSIMSVGQAVTCAFLVPCGATAYYASALTIDGTSVTPKWISGSTITSGIASQLNIYTYTLIKTTSATWTVLATQNSYA
jgi:hypothetical protein